MLSPLLIFSPDPLSQDTIFPSVMVLLRAGMKSSRTFALVTTLFETDLLCPPTRPTAFAALVATKLILTFLVHRGGGRVLVLLLLASSVSALRPLRTFRFFSYPISSQPLFRGRDVVHSISSVFSETFPILSKGLSPPSARAERARATDRTRMAPFLGPQALTRMHRELRMLETEPPPGVSAWPKDENKIHEVSGREPTALAALSPLADLSGTDYPSNVPRRSARGRDPGPSGHGVRGGILPAQRHRPVKVSAAPTLSCSKDDNTWADSLSLSISRTLWFARRAGTRSSPPASSSLRRSTTRTSTRREGYASTR